MAPTVHDEGIDRNRGEWQSAGLRHPRMQVLEALIEEFPWVLTPIE